MPPNGGCNVGHIFAAGDVNGRSKLVQTARLEGRIAAWNAVRGPSRQMAYDAVPSGSFTEAVSMAAQKACRAIGIGQFPAAWSYLGPEE